jgi:TolB-like protein/Tfp pilus assembly protein PilF
VDALRRADQTPSKRRALTAAVAILACAALGTATFTAGRPGPRSAEGVPRIAVLPLSHLTEDPEQDYFATALTDQLIGQLAQLHDLQVIAHSAVLPYEDGTTALRTVVAELDLDAVIQGSVARYGDEIRVAARLIDGQTEAHLWTRDFTRDLGDLLSLEREIAAEVARAVEINLSAEEESRLRRARQVSPEAQTAFLRGVYLQRRYQQGGVSDTVIQRSIEALIRATDLEPEWPEAHAELARAYHWLASGWPRPERDEYYPKARAAAERAIRLDETVAGGHAALAFVLHKYEWDWVGAERAYRRALELAPNDNYYRWGWGLFQADAGRYDEAVTDLQWALEQAPLSTPLHAHLAGALACAGRYEETLAIAGMYDQDEPSVLLWQARVLLGMGEGERALEYFERGVAVSDSADFPLAALAYAYASLGRERDARGLLPELDARAVPGVFMSALYAELGEPEKALEQLGRAVDQGEPQVLGLQCSLLAGFTDLTEHENLAKEPRMQALLRRIGFPE